MIDTSFATTQTPGFGGTGSDSSAASEAAAVDYDAFLTLLVAEMKNQDPTEPMDTAQWIEQLATFSNVSAATQTNEKLDTLLSATYLGQAGSLIGKNIASADGSISGTVSEVKLFSDGLIAVLNSGEEVLVGPGAVIS